MKKLLFFFLFMLVFFIPTSAYAEDSANINFSATVDGLEFTVNYPYEGNAYVGIYNDNGAILAANKAALINGTSTVEVTVDSDFDYAKVFIWADHLKPLTEFTRINFESTEFVTENIKSYDSNQNVITLYEDDISTYTLKVNPKKVFINGGEISVDSNCGVAFGSQISAENYKSILDYYLTPYSMADVKFTAHKIAANSSASELVYDTIYITTYIDAKVDNITAGNYKIAYTDFSTGVSKTLILDETDSACNFEIYRHGETASFSDIKEGDLLSIAGYITNRKLKYGKVYIVSDRVEGTVTGKSASANELYVDGIPFKATENVFFSVAVGDTAVFFKNYRGILVAADTAAVAANTKYGFATYARAYDADYGEPAQIRVLTSNGIWETFEIADTFSVNGGARVKAKDYVWGGYSDLVFGSSTKYGINKVIKYELNDEGKINKLYLSGTTPDIFEDEGVTAGLKTFDADTLMFGDEFMDENTVIFSLDGNFEGNKNYDTDEDEVTVVPLSTLVDSVAYMINSVYDRDDAGYVGAILGQGIKAIIDYSDDFFVVTDNPIQSTNAAGEEGVLLTGIQGGEEVTLFINTEDPDCMAEKAAYTGDGITEMDTYPIATISGITFGKGDVLLYTLNAKEEVAKLLLLLDASDVATYSTTPYGKLSTIDGTTGSNTTVATVNVGGAAYKFVFGYAENFLSGGNITLKATGSSPVIDTKTYAFDTNAIGTLCDAYTATGKVMEVTSDDIFVDSNGDSTAADGDMVFAKVIGSKIVEFITFANDNREYTVQDLSGSALEFDTEDMVSPYRSSSDTIKLYHNDNIGQCKVNISNLYINDRSYSIDSSCGITAGTAIDTVSEIQTVLEYYLKPSNSVAVKLTSTDSKVYDTIYLTVYEDIMVTRIAPHAWRVSFVRLPLGTPSTVVLDETDKDLNFEIYKDGEIASFADIKEEDVLSIAGYISDGELKYGKVYIVSDRVEGKVTGKSASANELYVDGIPFKATENVFFSVAVGDTAVFFKNYRGILVAADTAAVAANTKYGFATYARAYDADYGEPAQIRVLTSDGIWETFEIADTFSVNGGAREKAKDYVWGGYSDLVFGSSTKYGINKVIKYELNDEGNINKLYLANTPGIFEDEGVSAGTKIFDADTLMFGDEFMDENTVIFSLDGNFEGNKNYDTDEDEVTVVPISTLIDGVAYMINSVYDRDDNGYIGAILGKGIEALIDYSDDFFVLSKAPLESINEAGEEGILLTGIQGDKEVTLFINMYDWDFVIEKATYNKTSSDIDSQLNYVNYVNSDTFGLGDVLFYTLNSKGEADKISILVDASDITQTAPGQNYGWLNTIDKTGNNDTIVATVSRDTTYRFVIGYAKELRSNGNITLISADNLAERTYAFASDVIGTLYDAYSGNGKVISASPYDITVDSFASTTGADGNIVFAKVVDSRIVEFVSFANNW